MNRLKIVRNYMNITQGELAKKLGVKQNTVSYWENGRRQIDIEMAKAISEIAGCTVEYLIGADAKKVGKKSMRLTVIDEMPAGIPIEAVCEMTGYEEIIANDAVSGNYFALRVNEDGMENFISVGDIVIVRRQEDAENKSIVVVDIGESQPVIREITKHKGGIGLIPYNRKYVPVFYSAEDIKTLPVKILGRVVEHRRKF